MDSYSKMILSIGLPGARPGAILRLGKHKVFDRPRGGHQIDLCEEHYSWSVAALFRRAIQLDRMWRVDSCLVDQTDPGILTLLDDICKEARRPDFPAQPAPFTSPANPRYLLEMSARILERGLVRFRPGAGLPSILSEVPSDLSQIKDFLIHPAAVALGFALAELEPDLDELAADQEVQEYGDFNEEGILS